MGDIRLDLVDLPVVLPVDQVLVEVEACGLCGTDIAIAQGRGDEVPVDRPHPTTGWRAPLALGHEIVGRVVAGDETLVGSRVVVWPDIGCDCCPPGSAAAHLCPRAGHLGINAPGGMADHVVVSATSCVPVPESLPTEVAVLCEPMSVVLRAFRLTGRSLRGARVAVVGAGSIGLCAVDVAWHLEAAEVVVVDPVEEARAAALRCGASDIRHPADADGLAADVVVEASGAPAGLNTAMAACRGGGVVAVLGDHRAPDPLDLETLLMRELTLVGSVGHELEPDFRRVVRAFADGGLGFRPRSFVRVGLDAIASLLLESTPSHPGAKVLVVPGLTADEEVA